MWGDSIAAGQGKAWDPVHGQTSYSLGNQYADYPSVYGNQVAWVGGYNIYISTRVPEPSGLLALGTFGGLCWLMRPRKKYRR